MWRWPVKCFMNSLNKITKIYFNKYKIYFNKYKMSMFWWNILIWSISSSLKYEIKTCWFAWFDDLGGSYLFILLPTVPQSFSSYSTSSSSYRIHSFIRLFFNSINLFFNSIHLFFIYLNFIHLIYSYFFSFINL